MKRTQLLLVFCFTLISSLANAADTTIHVNVDEANPPFMYGRNGKAFGIYPALIQAAFKHLDIPLDIQAKPWKRTLLEIDQGRAGVGGIYLNSERLEKFDYSGPLFTERLTIYFNILKPINYTDIADLKGLTVGVLRGWSYGDGFDNARKAGVFKTEEVNSDDQNFRKLQAGRIDLVIAVNETAPPFLQENKNIRACTNPLSLNPTFLAFSKTAKRIELLRKFDLAINEMRANGELEKIISNELNRKSTQQPLEQK